MSLKDILHYLDLLPLDMASAVERRQMMVDQIEVIKDEMKELEKPLKS